MLGFESSAARLSGDLPVSKEEAACRNPLGVQLCASRSILNTLAPGTSHSAGS